MANDWTCMADGERFWCVRVWEHGIETWSGKLGAAGGRIHVKAAAEAAEELARAIAEKAKQGFELASPPSSFPSERKLKKPRWRARLEVDPRYRGASRVANAILDEDAKRLDRVFAKKQAEVMLRPRPEWEGEPPEPPLYFEAAAAKVELLDVFLAHGAEPRVVADGTTALHFAARNARVKCVQRLVERGASVDGRDAGGATPLHEAAGGRGGERIVQSLVALGADVAATDKEGRTPLHYAIQHGSRRGSVDAALALIGAGAPLEHRDASDMTPLELCRDLGRRFPSSEWDDLEATLLAAGAREASTSPARDALVEVMTQLDQPRPYPPANLVQACERGDMATVQAMLEDGADPNGFDIAGRRYPLGVAMSRGHDDMADALRRAGASEPTMRAWPPRSEVGRWAEAEGGHVASKAGPVVDVLASVPAQPSPVDANVVERCLTLIPKLSVATLERVRVGGRSVLELGCLHALRSIVDALLRAGVRADGHEALCEAASGGDAEIVRRLLEHGADPNPSGENSSALHAAARDGSLEAVKALVEAGANVAHETDGGHTSFNEASGAQRIAIRRFLRQHVRARTSVKLHKRKRMFVPSERRGTADRDEVARVPRIAGARTGIDAVAEVLEAAHPYDRDLLASRISGVTHGVFVIQLVDSEWTFLAPSGSSATIDVLAPRLAEALDAEAFVRHRDRQLVLRYSGGKPVVVSDDSWLQSSAVWLPPVRVVGDGAGDRGDLHELRVYGLSRADIARVDRVTGCSRTPNCSRLRAG